MVLAASCGLQPVDALAMTPYELSLYVRGHGKAEFRNTTRAVSVGYMTASLGRAKRIPPLRQFLPREPLTNLERSKKMWSTISDFVAMGIGKVKVTKPKGEKKKNG